MPKVTIDSWKSALRPRQNPFCRFVSMQIHELAYGNFDGLPRVAFNVDGVPRVAFNLAVEAQFSVSKNNF